MRQDDTYVNGQGQANGNPYSRDYDGTLVPERHEVAAGVKEEKDDDVNGAPVVGFLYSISRKGIGEYWPLHLGPNKIGRASDCDIILNEMSVSEHHAEIRVRLFKKTHSIIASISDIGSKNGILINDEEIEFESHKCKSNDIILIGNAYKLLLLLIDAEQSGLTIADNFVPAKPAKTRETVDDDDFTYNGAYSRPDRDRGNGTVDLSGDQFEQPGSTQHI